MINVHHIHKHDELVTTDLKKQIGRVRQLKAHILRGKLLCEIGNAIVIGKANILAWVTREAHLPDNQPKSSTHSGQVALNDLARVLTGHSRKERTKIAKLLNKAKVPMINEIVVKRSALEAWKARNGGALKHALIPISSTTRATMEGLVTSRTSSVPDTNIKRCWNLCPELRSATTLNQARKAAKFLSQKPVTFGVTLRVFNCK